MSLSSLPNVASLKAPLNHNMMYTETHEVITKRPLKIIAESDRIATPGTEFTIVLNGNVDLMLSPKDTYIVLPLSYEPGLNNQWDVGSTLTEKVALPMDFDIIEEYSIKINADTIANTTNARAQLKMMNHDINTHLGSLEYFAKSDYQKQILDVTGVAPTGVLNAENLQTYNSKNSDKFNFLKKIYGQTASFRKRMSLNSNVDDEDIIYELHIPLTYFGYSSEQLYPIFADNVHTITIKLATEERSMKCGKVFADVASSAANTNLRGEILALSKKTFKYRVKYPYVITASPEVVPDFVNNFFSGGVGLDLPISNNLIGSSYKFLKYSHEEFNDKLLDSNFAPGNNFKTVTYDLQVPNHKVDYLIIYISPNQGGQYFPYYNAKDMYANNDLGYSDSLTNVAVTNAAHQARLQNYGNLYKNFGTENVGDGIYFEIKDLDVTYNGSTKIITDLKIYNNSFFRYQQYVDFVGSGTKVSYNDFLDNNHYIVVPFLHDTFSHSSLNLSGQILQGNRNIRVKFKVRLPENCVAKADVKLQNAADTCASLGSATNTTYNINNLLIQPTILVHTDTGVSHPN